MGFGLESPDVWTGLSLADLAASSLNRDQCIVRDEHFFVCGSLEIPVLDDDAPFVWSVWVSLSPANFERTSRLWEDPRRVREQPCFGWFCNRLPGYPDTINRKTRVTTRDAGLRPLIELEPTDHPLAVERRQGITSRRVIEIAELLHRHNESLPDQ